MGPIFALMFFAALLAVQMGKRNGASGRYVLVALIVTPLVFVLIHSLVAALAG